MKNIRLPFTRPSIAFFKHPKVLIPTILLLGISLGIGGLIGYQYFKASTPPVSDTIEENKAPQDVLALIESVEKHVPDLPKNEFPSVATVKELNKLSDQAFFEGAKEGDKVMIYTVSKRAFLFRPDTGEVIRQGPVQIVGDNEDIVASSSAVLSASDSASPALRIKY